MPNSEMYAPTAQEEHGDDGEREPPRAERVGRLEVAHDRDHQPREHEVAGGDDHHAEDRETERPPVGPDVTEEARVEGEARHSGRRR
jgi:hypothetical protein